MIAIIYNKEDHIKNIQQYEANPADQIPVIWERAKDSYVWDSENKRYIDFTSSIFVMNVGHGATTEAIINQVLKLGHAYTFPTDIKGKFLRKLRYFLPPPCEKIYLASAGSEVTSWAIKLMRKYGTNKSPNKNIIVSFKGAFHGKTGDAEKLENQEIKLDFPYHPHEWENDRKLLNRYENNIAGVLIETYEGWSARFMPKGYVKRIVEWATDRDIPICFDEIQSGFYRTGKKFGYKHYECRDPDLLCLGKAIGGGMPLSALVGSERYFTDKSMSSTHSGHPICCASGIRVLEILEEELDKEELESKAEYLSSFLNCIKEQYPSYITEVQSHGLIASIIFINKRLANKVIKQSAEKALLLVKTGKQSIKIGPPLTITPELLREGLGILAQSITEVLVNESERDY